MSNCEMGPNSSSPVDLKEWHKKHIQFIRRFVQKYPTHALLEIDIEDPATADRMATTFQTNASYWGQENVDKNSTQSTGEGQNE